ncbi:DUF6680 family protein [Phaeobacter inhibens]|uniref:DUF6680 domain-containing protein n=1 Tax=Phaeobacter inhibens TaxID=221822 RepID=A0A2I7KBM9_9RHOB|nr:DUF6680 family protein [Phaeobacter inhibens]AUR00012.1 hypothetical protein PhaeoP88_02668 [Phaeobacter inhibens]
MQESTVYAICTLIAILAGPIIAVLLTRHNDRKSGNQRRRLSVFRDLMQTRGIRLDPLHVAALNVVELEFYEDKQVRQAFKTYIDHLSSPMPSSVAEHTRYFEQRSDLFVSLLSEIGKVLGYAFDKRDLDRHSYVPQGWGDEQDIQRKNTELMHAILSGTRPFPVSNFIAQAGVYPAPPEPIQE